MSLFPFGDNHYKDLDDMLSIIDKECASDGKNIFMHMMKNLIIRCMILALIVWK